MLRGSLDCRSASGGAHLTAVHQTKPPPVRPHFLHVLLAQQVELLQLQTASPEATTSQPASEASPPERKTPNKLPPLSRITVGRPSPLKMGMGFFPRTESVPAQARATREQPPPRKEKKTATRRVASLAVDLKEELRAESEKAAERASQRAAREKNTSPRVAGVQGTSVGGIELVPPAPLYSPEKVATDSTSRAPLFTVPTGGSGAGAGGGDLSSEPVGLGGGTATARTLLEGVGSGRLPEPLDVAEQVNRWQNREIICWRTVSREAESKARCCKKERRAIMCCIGEEDARETVVLGGPCTKPCCCAWGAVPPCLRR